MIVRYQILSTHLQNELTKLAELVKRVEEAQMLIDQNPQHQIYFIGSLALDLHSFYVGIERLCERIAKDIDGSLPTSSHWHRDLLEQMTLSINKLRPAVITPQTQKSLIDYLEFRHVVRHIYSFDLRSPRVLELAQNLGNTFQLFQKDMQVFIAFVEQLALADE